MPKNRFTEFIVEPLEAEQRIENEVVGAYRQIPLIHAWAVTIHKAQGSQWEDVQVFAPDLFAAAQAGRMEAGIPLWKRLAYVAITRAEKRLHWVVRSSLARPKAPLTVADLARPIALALAPEAD